jgi:hypothetical protein
MNHDHRSRLADSHRWQAESLGQTASGEEQREDDVGNLIVTGDVYGSDAAEIIRSLQGTAMTTNQPQSTTPTALVVQPRVPVPPPAANGLSRLTQAAIILAGLTGAGGLGALASRYFATPSSTSIQLGSEQQLGIEVVEGGAMK